MLSISLLGAPTAFATTLENWFTPPSTGDESDLGRAELSELKYKYYREQEAFAGAENYAGSDIVLTPSEAVSTDEAEGSTKDNPIYRETPLTDEKGKTNVIAWSEEYSGFNWTFNAPMTGFYSVKVEYLSKADDLGVAPKREFSINGVVPFEEAVALEFKKFYKDTTLPESDIVGDQTAPEQVEVREWNTVYLRDPSGYYEENLHFYFEEGENTISLFYANSDMFLGNIIICAPQQLDSYETVSATYPQLSTTGNKIVAAFQAEWNEAHLAADTEGKVKGWLSLKSSNMLRPQASKNVTVQPFVSGYTVINQMGGDTNWSKDREGLEWTFVVPADGLYKIALRVANNLNIGMPVHRQIYIDGEVPFEELNAYKFLYNYNYVTETLSDDEGTPYLFYLTEGEHTIRMETTMGAMGDAAVMFAQVSDELNLITREVNKILGSNPDANYDYRIEEKVPELIPTLEKLISDYEKLIVSFTEICETDSSSIVNEMKASISTIQDVIDHPYDIQNKLGNVSQIQTTMGSWITKIEASALMIDWIEIAEPAAEVTVVKSSIWKEIKNIWDSFIVSFSKDYNTAYDEAIGDGKDVVELWLSKDRENADLLMDLMNEEFTMESDYEFAIKLRITPGQVGFGGFNLLLLSLMSHQGPDLIWGTDAGTVVNYAIRGVGYDISQFEDYEEVVSVFNQATMIPLTYKDNSEETKDGVFGLPGTTGGVGFALYRTDIFSELGITPPETWDEYFDVMLPAFYKGNYQAMPSGAGTWLIQQGGWSYRAGYRLSGFDTELYYECFERDVDQYFVYGIDVNNNGFQGFRDDEYPYLFSDIGTILTLHITAPELSGKWGIAPTPGMYDELDVFCRAGGGMGPGEVLSIMTELDKFDGDEEAFQRRANNCWEIMKWWVSYDVQMAYTHMVSAKFGEENRYLSAHEQAFIDGLGLTPQQNEVIEEMMKWCIASPSVVLGSYQQDRYAGFAFNQVVIQGLSARDSIDQMIEYINPELVRKQLQYGIEPATEEEIANKVYDDNAIIQLEFYRLQREEAKKELEKKNNGE